MIKSKSIIKQLFLILLLFLSGSNIFGQAIISIQNACYIAMKGGTAATQVYIANGNPAVNGFTNAGGTGWIISENEFNMVEWNIKTNTGTYVVPFGFSTAKYLPLTLNISAAGVGSGLIKFSTYHTIADQNAGVVSITGVQSDVTNMIPYILPGSPSNIDDSYNVADRSYIIDANTGYTAKPAVGNITFSYISGTINSEVAAANILVESRLMALRFNSSTDTWNDWFGEGCTDAILNNVGTVQSGPVSPANFFRSWALWDETMPLPMILTPANLSCGGSNSGSASVVVSGGITPYTYSWSPAGGSSSTVSSLSAGTYTLTVNDNHGCTSTAAVTLTQSPALTATMGTPSTVLCNGGTTGSVTVTAAGGDSPYTYSWASAGGTDSTGTGLSAGTYTVTVTDNNGCTVTADVTITQPAPLTATIGNLTNIICNGGTTGSATVTAGGGTSPYTYAWASSGGTGSTGTGLGAGTFTVTVTDNNGCTSTAAATVTQPAPVTAAMGLPANVLCNGGTDGFATVTAGGGASPFTYAWASLGGTGSTGTGLSAGTFTVTVTDNNGCTGTASVIITQPAAISLTTSSTLTSCGVNNGTVTVTAGNGTSPYTYSWSPGGQTSSTATGLGVGIYTVTVTDNNGCIQTATATVSSPSGITASISASADILCNGGSTGSATVSVSGGAIPYTYAWTPSGGANATASGLSAGTYTVTVTDNNGCQAVVSVTITEPPTLTSAISSITNVPCNGVSTGSATVTVTGGTSPYNYNWLPSGGAGATANNLSAGTYTVTVTDNNGCTATSPVTITEPPLLSAIMGTPVGGSCNGGSSSSATVSVSGGTPAYTYAWTPSGGTGSTGTGFSAGTYTVLVTDNNGCTVTSTLTITTPASLTVTLNPTNITCYGFSDGNIIAIAAGGNSPYTYNWSPSGGNGSTASNLTAGTYTLTLSDANGCTVTATATITQPPQLSVSASGPGTICTGSAATLTSSVAGGTSSYTYLWSSGSVASTANVNPVTSTTYTLTVTDANGCTASAIVTINILQSLIVTITGAASFCQGDSAILTASVSGGSGVYTYLWQPGNNTTYTIIAIPASTTIYTLQVSDGCSSVADTVTVSIHPMPVTNFDATPSSGCPPLCVQFRDLTTVAGGTITQWQWNFGSKDTLSAKQPVYCFPDTGFYTISLTTTSNYGCRSTLIKTNIVRVYPPPNANFTYSPMPITILNPVVQFTSTSSGKYPPVYWFWNFGDGADSTSSLVNPQHIFSDTGTYCVSLLVGNQFGCFDTVTNCLVVEPDFTLYIPDAFSPNGDGINEMFMPKGSYIKQYDMYIFNRWEAPIFHSNEITLGWNGKVNGTGDICQEDTYYYLITITDSRGKPHSYTGMVNLLK